MSTVALIPVRGGSKSIPLKNIKEMAGKPLVYWTAKAANDCKYIDKVYISTDSNAIKDVANQFDLPKVEVIDRSEKNASDTASTESVMLEFAECVEFDNIVLIQATSPLLSAEDLDGGMELYNMENTDSVLSTVRQKRFLWKNDKEGNAVATNYDYMNRPRRQEFDGYLVENGAFYITSKARLLEEKCRISGAIKAYEMPEDTYYEIDEISDWVIVEQMLKNREEKKDGAKLLPNIKMVLTDCDGVLTDGGMYYSEKGDELKRFNTLDGMGIKLLREAGIIVGIITGEKRELNYRRAKKLNIDILKQGVTDKLSVISALCKEYNVDIENVLYIGDDVNDLEAISAVGFGCAVNNAQSIVKQNAAYVTHKNGGSGAFREVAEMVLSQLQ